MNTASGDNDDGGKVALQGQQRMQFDGGLVTAESSPRKQREAQVNGGGVQRISCGLEFKAERFIGVKRGGLLDEDVGEVGKDTPVPLFIGHRQRVAGGRLADAGVIELRAEGRQTGFDVAQTFAPRQLGEGQHEELFVSGQLADAEVAVVTGDTLVEFVFGQAVEELGEDGATFVHKVKNRRNAGSHPQGVVAELKSKNDRTTKKRRFYRAEIVVRKTLTGQQWYSNSVVIPGGTNATLILPAVTRAMEGIYWLAASNTLGQATSAPITAVVSNVDPERFVGLQWPGHTGSGLSLESTDRLGPGAGWQARSNSPPASTEQRFVELEPLGAAGFYRFSGSGTPSRFTGIGFVNGWRAAAPAGPQHRSEYTAASTGWTNCLLLTNLVLPTSPYLFVDDASLGTPARVYPPPPMP